MDIDEATSLLFEGPKLPRALLALLAVLSATVPPFHVMNIEKRLAELDAGITLLDAPVCHGSSSAD